MYLLKNKTYKAFSSTMLLPTPSFVDAPVFLFFLFLLLCRHPFPSIYCLFDGVSGPFAGLLRTRYFVISVR